MKEEVGSGSNSMSDAWMPFQPAIDEPSKKCPDSNFSGPKDFTGTWTCCSLPRVSVKRRSTNLTSLSLIVLSTSAGGAMHFFFRDRRFLGGVFAVRVRFFIKKKKKKYILKWTLSHRPTRRLFSPP